MPPKRNTKGANVQPAGTRKRRTNSSGRRRRRGYYGGREPEQQAPQLGAFPATTVPQAPSDLERNYMVEALQQLRIDVRPLMRPTSRKPYPDWIDRVHQFPKGYKVPEYFLFSGEENKSTIEHIARFSVQCGEAGSKDYLKLRLFANSLTKSAFSWYMNLPPNSINSWYDPESKFHEQFYRTEPDITVADLARVTQLQGESVEKYIARFRKLRTRCQTSLTEKECVSLALRGLNFNMREKFEGQEFTDLFHLATRTASYERLLKEKKERRTSSKGT